ncbi:MAG: AsmA-like C-terminal domain-containing protein, partial [Planctomycetia bacterium]
PYRGRVFGTAEVSGSRAGTHSLAGRGQLRLRDADIYELPLVVAMLKMLRVKAPDLNAFGSSIVDFRIEGPRAYLDNIELSGDAISLVGNGEIDFDSNVHMTFRSIMGDSATQLPAMKRLLGGASGQFMLIHVDGTLPHPEMTSEAFPTLAAAIQKLQSQRRGPDGPRSAGLRRENQR